MFFVNNYAGVLTFLVKFPKRFDHSSEFEMFESDRRVASGFISILEEESDEPLDSPEAVTESEFLPLTAEDIYRDFHLRGYQYAGQFCSILESDNTCMYVLFVKVSSDYFTLIFDNVCTLFRPVDLGKPVM
jgi:hypothetical protein